MATEFWGPDSGPAPVDTPAGMFTEVFKFPIGVDQAVNCHVVIQETYIHEDWSPTAAIALSELGRFEPEVVGEEYVKITAVLRATDAGRIYKLSLDGRILGMLGTSGKQLGQFNWMHGIDCSQEGVLYIADLNNWRVQKLILHE